jgi:competence protein ComEC
VRLARVHGGRALLAAALTLALGTWAALGFGSTAATPRQFTITFLDVGQGDATLLQAPDGATVLVDGGPPGAGLAAKLRNHGVRALDVVVLTHAQEDHQGGLDEVVQSFPVRLLLDGGLAQDGADHRRIVSLARERGATIRTARAGQRLRVGALLRLRVMAAAEGADAETDPNVRATVMTASYGDFDVFLPADAESEVTAALALPDVEVLKVAHHGSADEGLPALLTRLRPEVAVIEVGEHNRFGHPHPATMAALHAGGSAIHRTDEEGDVALTYEHGRIRVAGER